MPESTAVAVIGAGPAGLMAAQMVADRGLPVEVFDAMPSVGRKFLLAGKGGLNLTHAEPFEAFMARYGARAGQLRPMLQAFDNAAVRAWAGALGVDTFVGTSGRVFPRDLKAAPLLRTWLHRLRAAGVKFHARHRWLGWDEPGARLCLQGPQGLRMLQPRATVLALGGASWPQLGSDGAWQDWLLRRGVEVAALQPSNCGFDVGWGDHLRQRYAGAPLKSVAIEWALPDGTPCRQHGEFVLTEGGVEGSLVYAASAALRDTIARDGVAGFALDLLPARSRDEVQRELAHPRGTRSLATHLKSRLHLDGVKAALLWELVPRSEWNDPARLAAHIKALRLTVLRPRPVAEAISSAGGVRFEAMHAHLMLRAVPGVFCAGEMLDWEAPTGGYLLTACLATGRWAGLGALRHVAG